MLDINVEDSPDARAVLVCGELDLESAPRLLEAIRDAIKGAPQLKIDLKGIEYVDSSGIAVLIQGFKQARKASVEYVLRDPSPQVVSVIELSQLEDFFTFERTDGEGA